MNKTLDTVAMILVIIGGLNWGLIGLNMDWNVVGMIFGGMGWILNLIYILVGLSAVYMAVTWAKKSNMM